MKGRSLLRAAESENVDLLAFAGLGTLYVARSHDRRVLGATVHRLGSCGTASDHSNKTTNDEDHDGLHLAHRLTVTSQ
jgi:hypothetical protein